jgi:hypothetical protein
MLVLEQLVARWHHPYPPFLVAPPLEDGSWCGRSGGWSSSPRGMAARGADLVAGAPPLVPGQLEA